MFKRGVQDLLAHPDCSLVEADFNGVTEAALVQRLEAESSKLGMDPRESMVNRLKRRKLYKVARIFLPGERQQDLVERFEQLYYAPEQRRELEISLCRAFGKKIGQTLQDDEILLDIPRFGKSPEVDLKVFFGSHIPTDKADPLTFDDPEVSMLKEYLIGNFEAQAKVVRIFCSDNPQLRSALKSDAMAYLNP
jgi:hypothetical protein